MDEKILGSSKVTSKFQVTIPKDARKKLRVAVGDIIVFAAEGERVFLTVKVK